MTQATSQRECKHELGDRDATEVLSETPDVVAQIVAEHTTEQLTARPEEGKWTPSEILGHFTDAEWAFGWRSRQVLGDEGVELKSFDQDGWVAAQRFNEREPTDLVEMFRQLRRWNLELWTRLTAADLERTAQSKRRGTVTLAQLLRIFARHDLHHVDQLRRYLGAAMSTG